MIKIYHTDTQAIICLEDTKEFYYTTKDSAIKLSKSIKCSIARKEILSYVSEMLLEQNYNQVKI